MKIKVLVICFILIGVNTTYSDQKLIWRWLNGKWSIKNSMIIENRGWIAKWNYYAILDFNAVRTLKAYDSPTEIHFSFKLGHPHKKSEKQPEMLFAFAVRSPSRSWFYHIYGIHFNGNKKGIKEVQFIHSDRKDTSKRLSYKHNYFYKALAKKNISLSYYKMHHCKVLIHKKRATLYINKKKVLTTLFPSKNMEGRFAMGSRNIKSAFDKIIIKQGKKILLKDMFDNNTLKHAYVRAKWIKKKKKKK